MPPDFSPPAFKPRTGTPFTDAFRKWEATASLKEKQDFADGMNAIAASLREEPLPEVTVFGPDDPNQKPLGWMMYERRGTSIYKFDDDFRCGVAKHPIKKGELAAGDEVVVPGLFGDYHLMTVERDELGKMSARNAALLASLDLDQDEWVCIALINLRGVEKLTLKR